MTEYRTVVGLEIHAELKTQTKMFCNSKNDMDEKRPNVNICPICMGHPGTLPTINKEAVKHVLKVGLAVGGELADFTEFDRKNYFYPDIPKGYQLSQYEHPLVKGGELAGVKLTRIHLEEDTAKSTHPERTNGSKEPTSNGAGADDYSLVDFNRAGVPLMELVTEPVITSAKQAGNFARELQLLLQYLGVAEANMEKGEMRVEANISVSKDPKSLGTKVEVKNLNSFKAVEKAIEIEVARHIELLEKGEKIVQETRGFNEDTQTTFAQRKKESSHDYRYFPDPDLPKLMLSEIPDFAEKKLRKELPELPSEIRTRYKRDFEIKDEDIEIYVRSKKWGEFFEAVANQLKVATAIKTASNYITSDLMGLARSTSDAKGTPTSDVERVPPESIAALVHMIDKKEISSRGAKDILKIMFEKGGAPREIAKREGLMQTSDEAALKAVVEKIIADHPSVVTDYKAGKQAALQFLLGQAMKEMKGAGNPQVLRSILVSILG